MSVGAIKRRMSAEGGCQDADRGEDLSMQEAIRRRQPSLHINVLVVPCLLPLHARPLPLPPPRPARHPTRPVYAPRWPPQTFSKPYRSPSPRSLSPSPSRLFFSTSSSRTSPRRCRYSVLCESPPSPVPCAPHLSRLPSAVCQCPPPPPAPLPSLILFHRRRLHLRLAHLVRHPPLLRTPRSPIPLPSPSLAEEVDLVRPPPAAPSCPPLITA